MLNKSFRNPLAMKHRVWLLQVLTRWTDILVNVKLLHMYVWEKNCGRFPCTPANKHLNLLHYNLDWSQKPCCLMQHLTMGKISMLCRKLCLNKHVFIGITIHMEISGSTINCSFWNILYSIITSTNNFRKFCGICVDPMQVVLDFHDNLVDSIRNISTRIIHVIHSRRRLNENWNMLCDVLLCSRCLEEPT